ncbi:biotin-dependent carboxyltransferase family protein [Actinoplanes bogorensis]|uniref:Biotin-dependent carboxyltransferase family protein n=1 Tax=Paractinoplanes bogorensis TaxID=1610840 RepID=A0ABS5Z2Y0_9ACTN|nr:biotin-dependent carboxyltransferase family protein [Actinoplanes bogorensis]
MAAGGSHVGDPFRRTTGTPGPAHPRHPCAVGGNVITVVRAGPLTTIQDQGRSGYAHLGVPRSGALDQWALRRANALVGNPPHAAGLETTLLGCALRFERAAVVAVTGATAVLKLDKLPVTPRDGVIEVPAGSVLDIGRAARGVRSYVAVAGGLDVELVLGSRSTDTLSGLGPPKLTDGTSLPIGDESGQFGPEVEFGARDEGRRDAAVRAASRAVDNSAGGAAAGARAVDDGAPLGGSAGSVSPDVPGWAGEAAAAPEDQEATAAGGDHIELGVWLGPRDDWFDANELFSSEYQVSPMSNRVGCRLSGAALPRIKTGELPSEGVVLGAIQVPADGQPLIFLADHPTTGGYPVIGVVDDVNGLAQARPGSTVRFRALD